MPTDPISAAIAYRQALERIRHAATKHEAIRIAVAALAIPLGRPPVGHVSIASGFGHNTRQPFVSLALATEVETANPIIQLPTVEARKIALWLLESADAAESDGFIVEWMGSTAELSDPQAAALLASFRAYREKRRTDD